MANQLTCFIAAEQGAEKSDLIRQLEDRNVTCFSLDWTNLPKGLSPNVLSLIQRSDFVASILPAIPSPNLAYEIGLAHGLQKPLLLFAHETSSVPFDLASINSLPISLIKSQSTSYLDAFLKTVHPAKDSSRRSPVRMAAGEPRRWREIHWDYDQLIQSSRLSEADFEKLVERAFKQGGFLLSKSPSRDFGADFALTTPRLATVFSLPILIEIKNNLRLSHTQEVINRLSMLIQNGRGGAGLVVTTRPDKATPYLKGAQPIVVVPFLELFEWLRTKIFEQEFLNVVDAFWTGER